MNAQKRREIDNWLFKSRSDLGSARRLLQGPRPYLDTGVYHCQQAVEKALKAFLAHHDIALARTHDLTELLELCLAVDGSFAQWRVAAQELTPYAVQFRYPGEVLEPDQLEANRALQHAADVLGFVLEKLSDLDDCRAGGEP